MLQQEWTEVIEARTRRFDLKLKEIWQYRDLIWIFVKRDIISVYKQTILGPLWFFISPILTVITFTFVFSNIANISTDGVPAPLFYLAGTTLWNYFQSSFTGTSNTFTTNAGIFGKVYFPRLVSPISIVLSNLLKLFIQFGMFMIFWSFYAWQGKVSINVYALTFPLLVFLMAGIALGVGIIFSALTTKYRDITFFIGFGVSLLMYATPVIYPVSAIPDIYRPIVQMNPISPIIEAFRFGFCGAGTFSWLGLGYSSLFMFVTLLLGMLIFNKVERTFMDTV